MKLLLALLRIRRLMRIEQIAREVTAEIDALDREIDGKPPHYDDARPPTGDDYNALLSITERLRQ
jgi:hypothetical protein